MIMLDWQDKEFEEKRKEIARLVVAIKTNLENANQALADDMALIRKGCDIQNAKLIPALIITEAHHLTLQKPAMALLDQVMQILDGLGSEPTTS